MLTDDGQARNKVMIKDLKNTEQDGNKNKIYYRIATWNIRGINGKEEELIEEIKQAKIGILAITETKKKGQGIQDVQENYILLYSGVEHEKRAKAGVGIIMDKDIYKKVTNWDYISERLMTIDVETKPTHKIKIIVVYGPNEDDTKDNKDIFWETLTDIKESTANTTLILGDFNARVGTKDEISEHVLGSYGEKHKNGNGRRLIEFCKENDMIVANTFFKHKDIHTYTRELPSRNERSVLDYILINKTDRTLIDDVKARRGPEIYSDHYMVVAKINKKLYIPNKNEKRNVEHKKQYKTIKIYKLRDAETRGIYRQKVSEEIRRMGSNVEFNEMDVEDAWALYKNIMFKAAEEACGVTTQGMGKHTVWWNEEIKSQIKTKKQMWKQYLQTRDTEHYELYKSERKKVKQMVLNQKENTWKEFGTKLERNSKENRKLFFKVMKELRTEKVYNKQQIRNKEGKILIQEQEVAQRWEEYFRELYNQTQRADNKDEVTEEENEEQDEQDITINEIKEAVKKIKLGKSAGHDKITPEMIKYSGEEGYNILQLVYNKIWQTGKVPKDWELGVVIPIYKKGDKRNCNNYRGITLLSVAAKTFERVLDTRLRSIIEPQLEKSQSGFRKGYSIQDHIFTIKQIIEKTHKQSTETHLVFIDLEKAFDRIQRDVVWKSLKRRGVNNRLRLSIASMYHNTRNYVRLSHTRTEEFPVNDGLRQGGVLSPTLFITVMDDIIKETKSQTKPITVGYKNLQPITISECAFADDVVICGKSEKEIQHNLNIWYNALKTRNMKINIEKTKHMVVGYKEEYRNLTINDTEIERTNVFKYLGVLIERTGNDETEIGNRIDKTAKLFYSLNSNFLQRREVSKKTKMVIYKVIYRPILMFGSETWVLTRGQRSRVQAAEMRYLRKVKGITRRDRIRNEIVREELEIQAISTKIEEQQLGWFGHLVRMDNERPVKQVWEARVLQRRRRGRPRETWDTMVSKILERRGTTFTEARNLARNRKEWRKFIKED